MENPLFTKNSQFPEEEEKAAPYCPFCGCRYTKAKDGHIYKFCPDCGRPLDISVTLKQ